MLALCSCSDEMTRIVGEEGQLPIQLSGQIDQENVTRANDYGFVGGDKMGIYIVDRLGGQAGQLGATDNRAQNVLFTYDDNNHSWSSPAAIYWRDQQTGIDVYGYYPGVNYIESPTSYSFEVQADQSTEAENVMPLTTSTKLIQALQAVDNGVFAMCQDEELAWLVETSNNVASVETTDGEVRIVASQRSNVMSALDNQAATIKAVFQLAGAEVVQGDGYPAWKMRNIPRRAL